MGVDEFNFFDPPSSQPENAGESREYKAYLSEETVKPNQMEGLYRFFGSKLHLAPPESIKKMLDNDIMFSRMSITSTDVFSSVVAVAGALFIFGLPLSLFLEGSLQLFFAVILPGIAGWYLYSLPAYNADVLRVKAADESIQILLYMSIYMRISPNFERAMFFASRYSEGPITDDIRKLLWDLEMRRHTNIMDAISEKTPLWVKWAPNFVKSLDMLYQVLYQPGQEEREATISKTVTFILEKTRAEMEDYVEKVYPKISIIYAMGILMPAMGLVMFPVISIFLNSNSISAFDLAIGYLVILPAILFWFMRRILSKRPGAFKAPDISKHPDVPPDGYFGLTVPAKVPKYAGQKIMIPLLPLAAIVLLILILPGIFHFITLGGEYMGARNTEMVKQIVYKESELYAPACMQCNNENFANADNNYDFCKNCAYGFDNILSTLSITLAFAIGIIVFFFGKSMQKIKLRNMIKEIEKSFQIGLFMLGSFLAEGIPIESAVERSLEESKKMEESSLVFTFFRRLYDNIINMGMTFKKAILDPQYGVLKYFPSPMISEILRIVIESSERGTRTSAEAMKSIVSYLNNIDNVENMLKRLLTKVRSSLEMLAQFIVPMVTAITASLGVFILNMLKQLGEQLDELMEIFNSGFLSGGDTGGATSGIMEMIIGDMSQLIPLTVLQGIIGLYCIEVVILISFLLNGVDNGFDKVARDYAIGKNMIIAIVIYMGTFLIASFIFGGIITDMIQGM